MYNTAAELVRFNQCARDWHTWRNNHFGQPAEVKESGKDIIAQAGRLPVAVNQEGAWGGRSDFLLSG